VSSRRNEFEVRKHVKSPSTDGVLAINTKARGDIAEQAAVLEALKRGWEVLRPLGDRLPYDMAFDVAGSLFKIQVKHSWFDPNRGNYVVDSRRTKTNRREMVRTRYSTEDFDFALVYVAEVNLFYVFPASVFTEYASEIHLVESLKRQRKPKSHEYRDAWCLINKKTTPQTSCECPPLGGDDQNDNSTGQ
jgi:hypothetical protein